LLNKIHIKSLIRSASSIGTGQIVSMLQAVESGNDWKSMLR